MDEIASTQYGWIKNEKDFVKKSKLFYNFITNFERNGYSIFYDAMQKFKTGRRYCTEFGKFFIIWFFGDFFSVIATTFVKNFWII